jgi:predicted alpha/beta-hydrolase family hydrolase
MNVTENRIKIKVSEKHGDVSGILILPDDAKYLLMFAHGAGAGMSHSFMEKAAQNLAAVSIATLRYNFPYTEKHGKRPDPAPVLLQTVQCVYLAAQELASGLPVFAGGKSMGGRMTSTAASKKLLEGIKGIVFFGFPLHAPGQPSNHRAEHLHRVREPMLFLQGTKDKLADLNLLQPVINDLKNNATLHIVDGADHSFHLPKSAGKTDDEALNELARKVKEWADGIM